MLETEAPDANTANVSVDDDVIKRVSQATFNVERRKGHQSEFELDRRECEPSLLEFSRRGWKYVEPSGFKSSWHIECICEHLEAVANQQILRLLLNVPPRHMKVCRFDYCGGHVVPRWIGGSA